MNLSSSLTPKSIKPTIKKPMNLVIHGLFYCLFGLLLSSCTSLQAKTTPVKNNTASNALFNAYNYPISPDRTNIKYMQIQLLGSVALKSFKFDSIPVYELSGIAWDKDEQLLYAVSDEGLLYHLKPTLKDNKLSDMEVVFATQLKDINGLALTGKYDDSEGLALINNSNGKKGDTELVISFEKKPRISRYSTIGQKLASIKTPKYLHKKKYFRHKNKALESVAIHPKYGVITAAERPLSKYPITQQTIYSSTGKLWHFSASKEEASSVTGLEILPNGDALVLERAYSSPFIPINIKLRRIKLEKCNDKRICETETIANFNGADGWLLDNFEGLAHFKNNQYLIVSDNNESIFQKTIFMLFEIF
jgi:hypothetical protein